MGNSPLTVCINQAFAKQTLQVVLPDGQVLFMPHPLTVAMLMRAHPGHFVCQGSPSLLEQRLPIDKKLESGEIYYLLPTPDPVFTGTPTREFFKNNSSIAAQRLQQQSSSVKPFPQQVPYKPPPSGALLFDNTTSSPSFSDFARLSLKPQRCVINLFVFRQSVASIMPEETFKPGSPYPGDHHHHHHQYINKPRAAAPPVIDSKRYVPQLDHPPNSGPKQQHRGARGRKQIAPWKPHLESISETKTVLHAFSSSLTTTNSKNDNYINDFSVAMVSGIKSFAGSPYPSPPSSPLHSRALPVYSYGGQHQQQQFQQQQRFGGMIHSPLAGDRDSHRQRFIYSA